MSTEQHKAPQEDKTKLDSKLNLLLDSKLNLILDSKFTCKRCAKCCTIFGPQIRYIFKNPGLITANNDDTDNWLQLDPVYQKIIDEFNVESQYNQYPLMHNRSSKYLQENYTIKYLPTKIEFLTHSIFHNYLFRNTQSNHPIKIGSLYTELIKYSESPTALECIFLTKKNGNYFCTIHDKAPNMCKDYPKNNGDVCINQRERYFTDEYLQFKKKQYSAQIIVLNQILPYFAEHELEFTWDLFTFLIDFGFFNYDQLKSFFQSHYQWTESQFKNAVKDLQSFGLIYNISDKNNNVIESISSSLLQKKISSLINH